MNKVQIGSFGFIRALRLKTKSFTLVETLITSFLLIMLISSLVMSLSLNRLAFPLNSADIDLKAKVRIVMSRIARDVRQSVSWDIAADSNNPSPYHIKFRQVEGINTTDGSYLLSSYHIEYSYDNTNNTITRNIIEGGGPTQTVTYDEIVDVPFYTEDFGGNITLLNEDDVGSAGDLQTSGKLIIQIKGQKQIPGAFSIFHNMTMGVKVRNE
ncbi:MAG: hypothetical protein NG737_07170 [Omnitrophica bacterium]|nr:hypothetical protein [Candidatus Omnitrophota bacterium]